MPVDRELDIQVAQALGWRLMPGPKYDYTGPTPDQPDLWVPPGWTGEGYTYPPRGVIPATWHVPYYSVSRDHAFSLFEVGVGRYGKADCIATQGETGPLMYDVRFGTAPAARNVSYCRAVCHAFVLAASDGKPMREDEPCPH